MIQNDSIFYGNVEKIFYKDYCTKFKKMCIDIGKSCTFYSYAHLFLLYTQASQVAVNFLRTFLASCGVNYNGKMGNFHMISVKKYMFFSANYCNVWQKSIFPDKVN